MEAFARAFMMDQPNIINDQATGQTRENISAAAVREGEDEVTQQPPPTSSAATATTTSPHPLPSLLLPGASFLPLLPLPTPSDPSTTATTTKARLTAIEDCLALFSLDLASLTSSLSSTTIPTDASTESDLIEECSRLHTSNLNLRLTNLTLAHKLIDTETQLSTTTDELSATTDELAGTTRKLAETAQRLAERTAESMQEREVIEDLAGMVVEREREVQDWSGVAEGSMRSAILDFAAGRRAGGMGGGGWGGRTGGEMGGGGQGGVRNTGGLEGGRFLGP